MYLCVCVDIEYACVYVCGMYPCVYGGMYVSVHALYIHVCVCTLSMYVSMYVWTLSADHVTARLHARTHTHAHKEKGGARKVGRKRGETQSDSGEYSRA